MQPNWPSDRAGGGRGDPPRRDAVPVQPHRAGRGAGAGARPGPVAAGHRRRRPGAGAVRRPAARCRGDPARQQRPDRRQRLGGARWPRTPRRSCAPSGRCATRASTSCTSTSRWCPGAAQTALLVKGAPMLGTFHAAGDSAGYRYLRPLRPVARQPPRPPVRGVRGCRRPGHAATSAASTTRCSTASRSTAFAKAEPWPTEGPDDLLRRPPRAPQGPGRAARGHGRRCRPTSGCGWPATGPTPTELQARDRGDDRIEWLGRISDDGEVPPASGAPTCSAPRAARRVVRRRAAGGDGGRHAGRGQRHRRLSQRGHRRRRCRPGAAGRRRPPSATAIARVLEGGARVDALVEAGRKRADTFSMQHLATRYGPCTRPTGELSLLVGPDPVGRGGRVGWAG